MADLTTRSFFFHRGHLLESVYPPICKFPVEPDPCGSLIIHLNPLEDPSPISALTRIFCLDLISFQPRAIIEWRNIAQGAFISALLFPCLPVFLLPPLTFIGFVFDCSLLGDRLPWPILYQLQLLELPSFVKDILTIQRKQPQAISYQFEWVFTAMF